MKAKHCLLIATITAGFLMLFIFTATPETSRAAPPTVTGLPVPTEGSTIQKVSNRVYCLEWSWTSDADGNASIRVDTSGDYAPCAFMRLYAAPVTDPVDLQPTLLYDVYVYEIPNTSAGQVMVPNDVLAGACLNLDNTDLDVVNIRDAVGVRFSVCEWAVVIDNAGPFNEGWLKLYFLLE